MHIELSTNTVYDSAVPRDEEGLREASRGFRGAWRAWRCPARASEIPGLGIAMRASGMARRAAGVEIPGSEIPARITRLAVSAARMASESEWWVGGEGS